MLQEVSEETATPTATATIMFLNFILYVNIKLTF
jgi:hypothetical protein